MNDLKRGESEARRYLEGQGFKNIQYEPKGHSKPPDFLLEGGIAVEVQQLVSRDLQNLHGIWDGLKKLLDSYSSIRNSPSWYVSISCRRPPVPQWREIKKDVRKRLEDFQVELPQQPEKVDCGPHCCLGFTRAGKPYGRPFVCGSVSPPAYWVADTLIGLVQEACTGKARKVAGIRSLYEEWWLLLVSEDAHSWEQTSALACAGWDRVMLINYRDPLKAVDVLNRTKIANNI